MPNIELFLFTCKRFRKKISRFYTVMFVCIQLHFSPLTVLFLQFQAVSCILSGSVHHQSCAYWCANTSKMNTNSFQIEGTVPLAKSHIFLFRYVLLICATNNAENASRRFKQSSENNLEPGKKALVIKKTYRPVSSMFSITR